MLARLVLLMFITLNFIGRNLQNLQSDKPSPELANIAQLEQTAKKAYLSEDWATAGKSYQSLTLKIPSDVEPWFRLGNVCARTNNLDAAVATYREALLREPRNSKIQHNLSVVQLKQAANTFLEMQHYTEENDPLCVRARHAVDSIANLIGSDFQPDEKQ